MLRLHKRWAKERARAAMTEEDILARRRAKRLARDERELAEWEASDREFARAFKHLVEQARRARRGANFSG